MLIVPDCYLSLFSYLEYPPVLSGPHLALCTVACHAVYKLISLTHAQRSARLGEPDGPGALSGAALKIASCTS